MTIDKTAQRRYLIFAVDKYYPSPALQDIVKDLRGSFHEAEDWVQERVKASLKAGSLRADSFMIYDHETLEEMATIQVEYEWRNRVERVAINGTWLTV